MVVGDSLSADEFVGGSGGYAIAGYDYQIDVSVWLALDLVLASRRTGEIVLEPASEEDLEAELEPHEPSRLSSTVRIDGYRLVVQVKRRSGDAWTVRDVKALLEHGKARPSAKQRLVDPQVRYLLVTSAALNGGTRGLRVRKPGAWPDAANMPASIRSSLVPGAAGRVAIIGNLDEERLATELKRLLTDSFRVPNARCVKCIEKLRQEARVRIRGAGGGRWSRGQLEQVIKAHDGYVASSPELEHYVHPTNWQELRSKMRGHFAALIIGQSGTGKTMATRKLFDELSAEIPGLSWVSITTGPQQLQADRTELPVIYDIEDPWGRYDFDPRGRPWNDQLAQIFTHARHDRMVIATTRLDVAQEAGVLETVKPWIVSLEAEHYGPDERSQLFRRRIGALPRDMQVIAKESERTVLAELGTPLEIQKFFDALPTIDGDFKKNPSRLIAEAIRRAHQDSIERTVIDQIEGRDDVRAAAVMWALLKANDKLATGVLRQIEEALADVEPKLEKGVLPLVSFFVAARNFRQVEEIVTYYHPRVEAGIEKALRRQPLIVRRTLRHLLEVLASFGGPGEVWGTATAVRILRAVHGIAELKPTVSTEVQSKIDVSLRGELELRGKALQEGLQLAASAGSSDSNLAEVARFLLHRPGTGFPGFMQWGAPPQEDSWYVRMRADPTVKSLVERFVRELLPESRDYFDSNLVPELERLAPGLTPAFLEAARRAVSYGYINTSDVIAQGALADIAGFEAIVDEAVQILAPSADDLRRVAESRLDLDNEVYSEDYAEHLANEDDGHTAHVFLEAYVDHVRRNLGWEGLRPHRHGAKLLSYWLRSLAKDEAPDPVEVAEAIAAGLGSDDEHFLWPTVTKAGASSFEEPLIRRVIDGHPDSSARLAALECLMRYKPMDVPQIVEGLVQRGQSSRIVEITKEIGELRRRRTKPENTVLNDALQLVSEAIPSKLRELCDAAQALETRGSPAPSLSQEAIDFLVSVQSPSEEVRLFRVRLDRYFATFVPDDVNWLLAESNDVDSCVEAIESAIRHEMAVEIEMALSHKFAKVVAKALRHVAIPLAPPLPESVLALVTARGSPVRLTLADVLGEKPHAAHMSTLLLLAADEWSPRASYHGEADDYPIAQRAIVAIAKLGHVEGAAAEELYRIAVDTRDPDVQVGIFELLVCSASESFQRRLFDLAVSPGRRTVRLAAVSALLGGHESVVAEIVAMITPSLVRTRIEGVASRLLMLSAAQGDVDQILGIAADLATHPKRRVLLLLAIWVLSERDGPTAQRIAEMLPMDHVGVKWALAGGQGELIETALDDLGDTFSVAEVRRFLRPQK